MTLRLPSSLVVFALCLACLGAGLRAEQAQPVQAASLFNLAADQPGTLRFFGNDTAELFSREVNESFKGALKLNFVSEPGGKYPPGFLHASPIPQGWSGTFWTRDGGTFMRELTHWGYFEHACQVAQCLMDFAGTNRQGHVAFAEYFAPGDINKTGAEIDGHSAIIIAMAGLWQRLPEQHPFRARLYDFLHRESSPVRYLHRVLEREPLIPGANEFGPGCGLPGMYYNVVQNHLSAMALLIAADMEEQAHERATARLWRKDAQTIFDNMEKLLVDNDGSWIWCIDPKTLKPDPAVLNNEVNIGFGGINGVACMFSDVLGFEPLASKWKSAAHCLKTFEALYAFPLRKQQFDKYGFWSQFNVLRGGLSSGPAYGEGYALQTMLLFDKLEMADKSLRWLAEITYKAPGVTFEQGRLSPYYFYERTYSPEARGKVDMTAGCGPLNLISVTEPVKAARLILGVDDTATAEVRVIPRVPPSWRGFEARNWPIRTSRGMVRADLLFDRKNSLARLEIKIARGQTIPRLAVRMAADGQTVWKHKRHAAGAIVFEQD